MALRYSAFGVFPLCVSLCITMQVPEFRNSAQIKFPDIRGRLCHLNDASHTESKQVASAFKVVSNSTFNYITYFVAFDWMYALLDTSSVVTVSSSPLSIPDSTHGETFS